MTGFLVRRLIQAIIVIVGVVLIIFLLAHLIPGGEARAVLGVKATPKTIANFNRVNGLDRPLWDQFLRYLGGLPLLHLGYSYKFNRARAHSDRRAADEDARAGRHRDRRGPDRGDPPRGPPGGQAEQARRLRPHRIRVHPLRNAGIPPCDPADHRVHLPAGLASGITALGRVPLGGVHRPQGVHHAGDHPCRHHHRLFQPLHALVAPRRHGGGLHPHRSCEGRERSARSCTATPCATP